MRLLLGLGAASAGVLLFMLATASANTALWREQYPLLFVLNAALATLLAALVVYQCIALWRRYRARVFGSRLTLRFLALFAMMAVVPGLLVYTVSVQFLTKGIESWFDVKVDAALTGGISLGQSAIDQMLVELDAKAKAMAHELSRVRPARQGSLLESLRAREGVDDALIVSGDGTVIAGARRAKSPIVSELPDAQALRHVRTHRNFTAVEAAAGGPPTLRVVVPVEAARPGDAERYLQIRSELPESFWRAAEAVEAAYRDYRELALSRQGLKRIYVVTLTLALLVALFVAISLAAILSGRLSEPLADLARATQAVARGDFSRKAPVRSRDELGVLTESFNSMTRQLGDARSVLEANRMALETAKARLESILATLSAGVLVFDRGLTLSISNHGAAEILGGEVRELAGKSLEHWQGALGAFALAVRKAFHDNGERAWQIELPLKEGGKTLLVRGAALPEAPGGGFVLVFDDITQLIQAQRATAWADVARRLAHEFKNPLTPIQLSAERLEMKLAGRIPAEDGEALRRATQTIVNQVAALKSMVDGFREYARLPAPALVRLDLNALVKEVLGLYAESAIPITCSLALGLPEVRADPAQIRQVLHNLVQNAQDALTGRSNPLIRVGTELAGERVRMSVADNGYGFRDDMMVRIFEPYVTTKPHGTGLGLAIVKKIVDEHHGEIEIDNQPGQGAEVSVWLPALRHPGRAARAA